MQLELFSKESITGTPFLIIGKVAIVKDPDGLWLPLAEAELWRTGLYRTGIKNLHEVSCSRNTLLRDGYTILSGTPLPPPKRAPMYARNELPVSFGI